MDGGKSPIFCPAQHKARTEDRCFIFKRADWFRSLMIWVHLIGLLFLVTSRWMDVHVVYQDVSWCHVDEHKLMSSLLSRLDRSFSLDHGSYGLQANRPLTESQRISPPLLFGHSRSPMPKRLVLLAFLVKNGCWSIDDILGIPDQSYKKP